VQRALGDPAGAEQVGAEDAGQKSGGERRRVPAAADAQGEVGDGRFGELPAGVPEQDIVAAGAAGAGGFVQPAAGGLVPQQRQIGVHRIAGKGHAPRLFGRKGRRGRLDGGRAAARQNQLHAAGRAGSGHRGFQAAAEIRLVIAEAEKPGGGDAAGGRASRRLAWR